MSTEMIFVLSVCAVLGVLSVMSLVGYVIACKLDRSNLDTQISTRELAKLIS